MTELEAWQIIQREYGSSRNFMTPNVLRVGKINPNVAFELSTGRGIRDQTIFGVTVVRYYPESDTTDRNAIKSDCFQSRANAERYIKELMDKYGDE